MQGLVSMKGDRTSMGSRLICPFYIYRTIYFVEEKVSVRAEDRVQVDIVFLKPLFQSLDDSLCWSILFKGKLRIPVLEKASAGSNVEILIHQKLSSNWGLLFNLTSFPSGR